MSSYLVKIGGSLIPHSLPILCEKINEAARDNNIYIVAGGGRIVESIRLYRSECSPSLACTHNMALLALDQHALLLADLLGVEVVHSLAALKNKPKGDVGVIAPSLLFMGKSLINKDINQATSDTVASLIAKELNQKVIFLTDVDGVFDKSPQENINATLLEQVFVTSLVTNTSIDMSAASVLEEAGMSAWVLNGRYPDRLLGLLRGEQVIGTQILASIK